jgi:hypothetical protein
LGGSQFEDQPEKKVSKTPISTTNLHGGTPYNPSYMEDIGRIFAI